MVNVNTDERFVVVKQKNKLASFFLFFWIDMLGPEIL